MNKHQLISFLLVLAFLLTACEMGGGGAAATELPAAATEVPTAIVESPAGAAGLAPEPQEISFQASDGQALKGLYYPAAVNPAPVVVLMHWVMGDRSDWYEVAPWLQNRGLENPFPNPGDFPWWDPAWFPKVPENRSYGVFIFTYRTCKPMNEQGCTGIEEALWLLDSQAAMLTATTLEGVDPARVVAIGSSIGADGAADGCFWLNEQKPGSCQGALSLSPGDYLTVFYVDAVKTLGKTQPPVPAWCLADENEITVCNAAASAGNVQFKAIEIPGGQHGNMLLRPDLDPLPMSLILDFLVQTVGP